jgi:hypothetical protein
MNQGICFGQGNKGFKVEMIGMIMGTKVIIQPLGGAGLKGPGIAAAACSALVQKVVEYYIDIKDSAAKTDHKTMLPHIPHIRSACTGTAVPYFRQKSVPALVPSAVIHTLL